MIYRRDDTLPEGRRVWANEGRGWFPAIVRGDLLWDAMVANFSGYEGRPTVQFEIREERPE